MSKDSATVIKDGQLAVATVPQTGTLVGAASEIDATALVETADGLQLCVKTCEVGGGGGGGGTVDQTYDPTSTNAQSGTAVAEAVAPALKNKATNPTSSLMITNNNVSLNGNSSVIINPLVLGNQSATNATAVGTNASVSNYSTSVGYNAAASASSALAIGMRSIANSDYSISIGTSTSYSSWKGANVDSSSVRGIAIGTGANVSSAGGAIQLGEGTNSTANSFQVFSYQMLDGTTGKIPAARIGTGYDATKTQVLKNVNGTLTWVDE